MLQFEWNALRRGDHVLVHDATDADLGLVAGDDDCWRCSDNRN